MIYEINLHDLKKETQIPELFSHEYINDTLSIYNSEHIYLESANWQYPELSGRFRIEHYVFTKKSHIDYVTATMVMLYLSQLGYVYTRIFCERGLLPPGFDISTDEFYNLRDIGNIIFTGFDKLRFRKRIPIIQDFLELKMSISKFHIPSNSLLVGDVNFNIDRKAVTGNTKVAIILDRG